MAHDSFVQDRIDQIETLLSQGVSFENIAEIIKTSGLMIIRDNKDTTEDWVFNQCLILLANRMEAKQG
jgi:hypothetical protein